MTKGARFTTRPTGTARGMKDGMRLILRILGTWLIAMAVILLIIDGTRSLGASGLVLTSLNDSWESIHAASLAGLKNFIDTRFFGPVLEPMLTLLLSWPGFVVLGVPGIVLLVLGRSRRSRRFVRQDQF
jgi:hypothetical protein